MENKKMLKAGRVVTKILEIFHWVGAAILGVATVCALFLPSFVKYFIKVTPVEGYGAPVDIYGYKMVLPFADGSMDMKALFMYGIGGVVILVLMAMIFRNLSVIMKNAMKDSPFHKDNIKMLKQVGIFSMTVPVVELVMSIISHLVKIGGAVISVNMEGFCIGIIVLALTQFFIHGAKLEDDVEGLV